MPKSNHGGSNRNSSTSKQRGDNQRSSHSEKGKTGQGNQGAQGQKGKEDIAKGKMNNQHEGSDRNRSESYDEDKSNRSGGKRAGETPPFELGYVSTK